MIKIDIPRMEEALKTNIIGVPEGLSREHKRELILERAEVFESIKEAAKVGNLAMEYYLEHGVFPTSRNQLGLEERIL